MFMFLISEQLAKYFSAVGVQQVESCIILVSYAKIAQRSMPRNLVLFIFKSVCVYVRLECLANDYSLVKFCKIFTNTREV